MPYQTIDVFGIYRDRGHAEQAVDALRGAGFRNSDVSVLLPDHFGSKNKGTVGGALGWLAGIGALAVPGVGPFIASGPVIGALAGSDGGVSTALAGLGICKTQAVRYEGIILEGGVLLSVHCEDPDRVKNAMDVLRDTSAKDVSFTGEAGSGTVRTNSMSGR